MKNKNLIGVITGVAAVILAYLVVQSVFFNEKPGFDGQIDELATELNKSCPIMLDNETRLDSATALTNSTFHYHYTLVNMERDSADIAELEDYLEPIILQNLKTSPDLKTFRNNDVTVTYSYRDKNEEHLFKLTFTPEEYKQ